jgi:hypothetical protein
LVDSLDRSPKCGFGEKWELTVYVVEIVLDQSGGFISRG